MRIGIIIEQQLLPIVASNLSYLNDIRLDKIYYRASTSKSLFYIHQLKPKKKKKKKKKTNHAVSIAPK